jgi:putative SOS response-associated peptidase YedK
MCGRFQLSVKGKEISERFNTEVFDEMYKPSYNCAPTQRLPVIVNFEPQKLHFFHWGLVPAWAKDTKMATKMINSRAETITEKPAFKKAFETQRCLIPANGFYEWKRQGKAKIPYRFFLKNEALFAMAGIWESWYDSANNVLHSFSIITTQANSLMEQLHHRMPVILRPEDEAIWLGDENPRGLKKLLEPFPAELMDCYTVSQEINSARHNGPSLAKKDTAVNSPGEIPGLFDE